MENRNESADLGAVSDSVVRTGLPALPMRAGTLPMAEVIDLYMGHYAGRDTTRVQRLTWWRARLGDITLQAISDDDIHGALEALRSQHGRFYAGDDADGKPIYRAKRKPMAPATQNRYNAAIGAVFTWAMRKRIAPKGWAHPCRSVERRPENNERIRYLSDAEKAALEVACKASKWPRMHLLVQMALTTGARRGELLEMRWKDIDLKRAVAVIERTKNEDAKTLPLVPAVVEELRRFEAGPTILVFPSARTPDQPYNCEQRWQQTLKAAKIKRFKFHDLRHTCASTLAMNGASLVEIADILGHRDLKMSKRYSHLSSEHKANLVNRVFGGGK